MIFLILALVAILINGAILEEGIDMGNTCVKLFQIWAIS